MTEVQHTTTFSRNMNEDFLPENIAIISGTLMEQFSYNHTVMGKDYFKSKIKVKRLSGVEDIVPIIASKSLLPSKVNPGMFIEMRGCLSSFRRFSNDGKSHLDIFTFPHELHICNEESELKEEMDSNKVFLCGTIIKKSEVRATPYGRFIMDLMIKVPRPRLKKAYYFPCIAWGYTAMALEDNSFGDYIKMIARFQSREYFKRSTSDEKTSEYLTTYELSIMKAQAVSPR